MKSTVDKIIERVNTCGVQTFNFENTDNGSNTKDLLCVERTGWHKFQDDKFYIKSEPVGWITEDEALELMTIEQRNAFLNGMQYRFIFNKMQFVAKNLIY
jgi:hypothetical protein